MARMLRGLLLLTLVLGVAVVVVSADVAGWIPSFGVKSDQDKAKEAAAQSVNSAKSWTNWATNYVPYFSGSAAKQTNEQLDASKDTAANVAGEGQEKAKTAADAAKEYAAKGLERVTSTKDQLHGATKGFIQRWGSWVKDNAGKYYSYGPLSQKASDKATDVVDDAATKLDSAADSTKTKEYVDSAKEEVLEKTDEKEL